MPKLGRHFKIVLWIALSTIYQLASAVCPDGCVCANTVVVCTCGPTTDGDAILGSFRNIDFVSKIYIHNCRNLTIPADAFAGLSIGHELSISSVRWLYFQPFAFRDLVKYPEKFVVADCGIPVLPANTFVGFHRVIHMWFRNANISKIADGAFRHVSDIEYVYFRESNVGRIESKAFSNMTNISHLFFRGRTKIDQIESSAFHYSTFKKIHFEDVRIRSLNAYAFNGPLRYDSMVFENVTVENIDFADGDSRMEKITSARKLDFVRSRFERRLPLSVLCSNVAEVRFEDTQIDRLVQLPMSNLRNITRLRFLRSTINAIESRAFYASIDVRSIVFEECATKSMGDRAFAAIAGVEELIFLRSSIGQFSTSAFENAAIKKFEMNGCRVDSMATKSFVNSRIDRLRFAYSEIKSLESGSFDRLNSDYFGFEYVRFGRIGDFTFDRMRVDIFNVSNCHFRHRLNETWLSGISFRSVTMNFNKFLCSCNSKSSMQMAELKGDKESTTRRYSMIGNNLCIDEASNETSMMDEYFRTICRKIGSDRNVETYSGLKCRKSLFLVSCQCTEQSTVIDDRTTRKISILQNATTFSISDCRHLRMSRNSILHLSLSHLIITKSENVELETDFWWQKSTHPISIIGLSDVGRLRLHGNAFSFSQPAPASGIKDRTEIEFNNCTIKKIQADVFENARVGRLIFADCRIGNFESLFARKSRIDELSIVGCEIGRFSKWALNDSIVEKFRLEKSRIYELQAHFAPEKLTKKAFICFVDNRLACRCDIAGMDVLLNANGCDGGSNLCFENSLQTRLNNAASDKVVVDDFLAASGHENGDYRCYDNNFGAATGSAYDLPQRDTAEWFRSTSENQSIRMSLSKLLFALGFLCFCLHFFYLIT